MRIQSEVCMYLRYYMTKKSLNNQSTIDINEKMDIIKIKMEV